MPTPLCSWCTYVKLNSPSPLLVCYTSFLIFSLPTSYLHPSLYMEASASVLNPGSDHAQKLCPWTLPQSYSNLFVHGTIFNISQTVSLLYHVEENIFILFLSELLSSFFSATEKSYHHFQGQHEFHFFFIDCSVGSGK